MTHADTLVVIPTYNERDNVARIVPAVLQAMPCDVLVVDDQSPDGTGPLADELARNDTRVRVVHRSGPRRGLGAAYQDAFDTALKLDYPFLIQMDADFSHDPNDLPRLRAAAEDADLVIGSRYVPGGATPDWPWRRRMLSVGGSWYARSVLGLPFRDLTGGFKCWRASALARIDRTQVNAKGFGFQIEMTLRAQRLGFCIREIPIVFCDRVQGDSKMSMRIVGEALLGVVRLRFRRIP